MSLANDTRAVTDGERRTWALDLGPVYRGGPDQPIRAHLIVRTETSSEGKVRWSECGRRFTAANHPRGWWTTDGERLPLQEQHVHCGAARSDDDTPASLPAERLV